MKLVKCSDTASSNEPFKYSIEFRFDCDCDTQIKIHYFAIEKYVPNLSDFELRDEAGHDRPSFAYQCGCAKYIPKLFSNSFNQPKCICLKDAPTFKRGANILFRHPTHTITPAKFHFNAVSISSIHYFLFRISFIFILFCLFYTTHT